MYLKPSPSTSHSLPSICLNNYGTEGRRIQGQGLASTFPPI